MTAQADVLARYEQEYQRFHRITEARIREGQNLLRQFGEFAEKPVHECDANDIRAFLAHLTDDGLKITTIAKKLNLLRPFYGWCWNAGLLDADDYLRIKDISAPRGSSVPQRPRPYSKKELEAFRQQLDERWPTVKPILWERWRRGESRFTKVQPHMMRIQIEAIVALALHCGLRRHEIYEISIDDAHFDNEYVVVREGKGGKYREVPHTATSRAAIKAWIELRTELVRRARRKDHDCLWLSLAWRSVALKPMSFERFAGLLRTIGPWELHRFRHTCGTNWLRATKRLEIVQKLLGHSRVQQTLTYAQLVNDDLLAEVGKAEQEFERAIA